MDTINKEYKRNIILEYLHTFFRNTNFTHGIWAAYLLVRGYTLLDIGVFETVFHITSLTMEVPTGVLGDLFGRKNSRLLGIVSYLIYIALILFTNSYLLIIIAFIFCGISYTFESGSQDALIYDSLKEMNQEDKYMRVNGRIEVIYQVATVIVLFLTGIFLEGKHETDYYLTIGLMVIAFVMLFSMKETQIPHKTKGMSFRDRINDHFIKTWKVVTSKKRLFLLMIFGALLMAPVTSMVIYAQEYFIFDGFRESWMLYFLALHGLIAGFGGLMAERIEHKFGERKLMIVLPILLSLCFFATLIPTFGFIGFILIGFIDSALYVVIVEYINRLIPSDTRASVLSFFGMSFSFVMILTFPLMGLIGTFTTIWFSYLFVAIIVVIVVIILQVLLRKNYFSSNE